MYYAEELGEWISSLNFEDIPEYVIDKTKNCIIDWVGTTLYGERSPWSRVMIDMARELGGKTEATIAVSGEKVPASNAAMANAVMAISYDFSDTDLKTELHPGPSVIASAIAMAERERSSGKEVITAIIAAYEIATRVAEAFNCAPHLRAAVKGFEPNGMLSIFGPVVSASKILKLDSKGVTNAIGLAGSSMGGGLVDYMIDGNWTYRWSQGKGAAVGIINALMAEKGFIGPAAVFEGQWDSLKRHSNSKKGRFGALNAYIGTLEDSGKITKDLGKQWRLNDIVYKYYGCCHGIQGYIDGALQLMRENSFRAGDIKEITVRLPHFILFLVTPRAIKSRPPNLTVTQWSLPFSLARAILDGHLFSPQEQLSNVDDVEVLGLADRINVIKDTSSEEFFSEKGQLLSPIEITLHDDRKLKIAKNIKGIGDNALTQDELEDKFNILSGKVLPKDKVAELINKLKSLQDVKSITEVTKLMVK